MNNHRMGKAGGGDASGQDTAGFLSETKSGVVPRMMLPERPSWDEVDEYVREGKHVARVERYAGRHPDFAEVIRWLRNEVEAEERAADSTPHPFAPMAQVIELRPCPARPRSTPPRSTPPPPDQEHIS
jgi:hypothetical protein